MEHAAKYDDILPVSLANDRKRGVFVLLDRHNDHLADFDQSRDDHECQRIVDLINTSAAAYQRGLQSMINQRAATHAAYNGGWTHDDETNKAFHHGMDVVFDLIRDERDKLTRSAEGAVDASQAQ